MEDEQTRRTVKLSVKALANKIEKDQKDRNSHVKQMKELTKEIKGLMKNDANANDVQSTMGQLINVYESAKASHESLTVLIPQEEQDNQNVWFSHVTKHHTDFMEDVTLWFDKLGMQSLTHEMSNMDV